MASFAPLGKNYGNGGRIDPGFDYRPPGNGPPTEPWMKPSGGKPPVTTIPIPDKPTLTNFNYNPTLPKVDTRGVDRLNADILSGAYNVKPVSALNDPFIKNMMASVRSSGEQAGRQAQAGLLRSQGPGASKQAALMAMLGGSTGARDAMGLGLEEGRFRTGVEMGNADRRLNASGQLISGDLGVFGANMQRALAPLQFRAAERADQGFLFDADMARRGEERAGLGFNQQYGFNQENQDWLGETRDWMREDRDRLEQTLNEPKVTRVRTGGQGSYNHGMDPMYLLEQLGLTTKELSQAGGYLPNAGTSLAGDYDKLIALLRGLGIDLRGAGIGGYATPFADLSPKPPPQQQQQPTAN